MFSTHITRYIAVKRSAARWNFRSSLKHYCAILMMDISKIPKVELHQHMDGAIRHSTILDLARQKNIDIGAKTLEELRAKVVITKPVDLATMLAPFHIFMPAVLGDPDAIERIAFELCEDMAKQNVIYFETRHSPHFGSNVSENGFWQAGGPYRGKGEVSAAAVVEAAARGLARGEQAFGVKARQILCGISAHEHWAEEVLQLAVSLRHLGVVAIDIAGCSHGADERYEGPSVKVFQRAEELGVHRTVHAGESGTAKSVLNAITQLRAERIGHGYKVVQDEEIYARILKEKVHLEVCPTSSYITGSVPTDFSKHPAVRFAKDGANFSLNTDDPTIFDNSMNGECKLAHEKIGLSMERIWQCQVDAAEAAFLPEIERKQLVSRILAAKKEQQRDLAAH